MKLKASDLKELSIEELLLKVKELREELFHLRRKNALKQLSNIRSIRKARKDIARILTIINEKKKRGDKDEAQ